MNKVKVFLLIILGIISFSIYGQSTRLLRNPDISETHVTYSYAGDIWVTELATMNSLRLTSTAAIEREPHFSPDGKTIAFSSNRFGSFSVFTVSITGGEAKRVTWHPDGALVRGWTNDGSKILYASGRETAPSFYHRLWTVPNSGGPSELVTRQWGNNGSYNPEGNKIVIDKMRRWDEEWRAYRGGQNTPLIVLNLEDNSEILIPNERTTDLHPIWIGSKIYFLSDRDWVMNIWSYDIGTGSLTQVTNFTGNDIKSLSGHNNQLVFERSGNLFLYDLASGNSRQLNISLTGDFPWAEAKWEDVSSSARFTSLSPTGKRAIMESRGEIFTVPAEFGDTRNITNSSSVADRRPLWSPKGDKIAWFSDASEGNKDQRSYSFVSA